MESLKGVVLPHGAGDIGGLYLADQSVGDNYALLEQEAEDILAAVKPSYVSRTKRFIDIAISVAALGAFGVLLPFIAVGIKIDSPGPIFFHQSRIGLDRRRLRRTDCQSDGERRNIVYPGRPFDIIKLRTMRIDAEKDGPQWATKNDTRITPFGNFLRKTRLDEFPQFLNVLRGDMSVIGPRPERLIFIRQLENDVPCYLDRLAVLPGITGLAQIINGYDTDLESVRRKVALDRKYIRGLGWKSDLRIFLMTFRVLFSGEGAH